MPGWKLTIDGVVFENDRAVSIRNIRPENGISSLEFTINNYKSTAFDDLVAPFSDVQLDLKCKNQTYTTTFYGEVYALQPQAKPEVLTVYCRGLEQCLVLTHCDSSFGVESKTPAALTPRQIIQEIVSEYAQKHFGGNVTWWGLDSADAYVDNVHNGLSVTNLTSQYHSNLTLLNRLCEIVNAYALTLGTPEPGIHWFAYPNTTTPRLYVKEIGDDHSTGNWDKYYGGSQTAATITQGIDVIDYSLHKTLEHYANNVLFACNLRKPPYDYWCEAAVANGIWTVVDDDITLSDDSGAGNFVVGLDSLKFTIDASQVDTAYMDFANNLNLSYLGSQDSVPTISFYARRTSEVNSIVWLDLYTTRNVTPGNGDSYWMQLYNTASDTKWMPEANKWYGITIPIGPHYKNFGGMPDKQWNYAGAGNWNNLDGIQFYFNNTGFAGENYFWVDDLHFSGKIVRDARDASEISATSPERQVFLRLDTAIDDSCNITDNTGTAARLCASELFKRMQFQTSSADRLWTGTISMPMKEDLLPGQQLYVNVGKLHGGTFKHQRDMRCKSVIHEVSVGCYTTHAKVNSDLWNSLTFDTPSAWGILQESAGALRHAEARDLKSSGVDTGISRLAWDPTV